MANISFGSKGGSGGISQAIADARYLRHDAAQGLADADKVTARTNAGLSEESGGIKVRHGDGTDQHIPLFDSLP
jgi:hypothetical protein